MVNKESHFHFKFLLLLCVLLFCHCKCFRSVPSRYNNSCQSACPRSVLSQGRHLHAPPHNCFNIRKCQETLPSSISFLQLRLSQRVGEREKVLSWPQALPVLCPAVCLESEKLCACEIVARWQPKNGPTTQPRPRIQRRQAPPSTGGHFEVSYKTNQRTRMKLNLYCCVCRSTRINFSSNERAHIKTTDSAATATAPEPEPQPKPESVTAAAVQAIDGEEWRGDECIRVSRSWQNVSAL